MEVANPVIVLFVNVSVVDEPTILILLPAALSIAHLVSLWSNTNAAFVEPTLPTLNPESVDDRAVEPVKFKSMILVMTRFAISKPKGSKQHQTGSISSL